MYGFDMRCIRDIAIAEPLVDNVNQDQICTEVYRLLTLDIMSMNKTAASFKVDLLTGQSSSLMPLFLQ